MSVRLPSWRGGAAFLLASKLVAASRGGPSLPSDELGSNGPPTTLDAASDGSVAPTPTASRPPAPIYACERPGQTRLRALRTKEIPASVPPQHAHATTFRTLQVGATPVGG